MIDIERLLAGTGFYSNGLKQVLTQPMVLHTMPPQLHIGSTHPDSRYMKKVKNIPFVKPEGGLWTSTYLKEYGSEWAQFCMDRFGKEKLDAHLLYPDKNLKVLVIDSASDLDWLHTYYPNTFSCLPVNSFHFIDYEKLATEYDGIHLTSKGERDTRFKLGVSFYGWDVESTLWFRFHFERVVFLGKKKFLSL